MKTTAVFLLAAGLIWADSDNAKGGYYENGKGSKGGPSADVVTVPESSTVLEIVALLGAVTLGAFVLRRKRV